MSVQAVPSQAPRTSQAIQQEFNNIAFRAGHVQHDIDNKKNDLKMFNDALRALQVEYNTVKQQEDAAAKATLAEAPAAAPAAESQA